MDSSPNCSDSEDDLIQTKEAKEKRRFNLKIGNYVEIIYYVY